MYEMYLYYLVLDTTVSSWVWRHKPLDSALQRQRQMALCASEPSLVYIKKLWDSQGYRERP